MDRPALMAIVLAFLALLLLLMVLGWRARKRRQKNIAIPDAPPSDTGAALGRFTGKYVATTAAGKPLERIAASGLGFRSNVVLVVSTGGLVIERPGSVDVWIARDKLTDLRRATWTIDRAVEEGGLDLVEWTLGDSTVDSYFRLEEPTAFDAAVNELLGKASK